MGRTGVVAEHLGDTGPDLWCLGLRVTDQGSLSHVFAGDVHRATNLIIR
jgi:hypothetical protein